MERQALFNDAFPQLQDFCHQQNLDFEVVDLRWRAGKHINTDLREKDLHTSEIQHCRKVSLGPYFVVIVNMIIIGDFLKFR